jgi:hypothetical protein
MNEHYNMQKSALATGLNLGGNMIRDAGATVAVQAAVHRALEGQDSALKMLYSIVDVLGSRLSPVLGPEMPSPVNSGKESARSCSPVTDRINQNETAMRNIHDRITALLDRLEV